MRLKARLTSLQRDLSSSQSLLLQARASLAKERSANRQALFRAHLVGAAIGAGAVLAAGVVLLIVLS